MKTIQRTLLTLSWCCILAGWSTTLLAQSNGEKTLFSSKNPLPDSLIDVADYFEMAITRDVDQSPRDLEYQALSPLRAEQSPQLIYWLKLNLGALHLLNQPWFIYLGQLPLVTAYQNDLEIGRTGLLENFEKTDITPFHLWLPISSFSNKKDEILYFKIQSTNRLKLGKISPKIATFQTLEQLEKDHLHQAISRYSFYYLSLSTMIFIAFISLLQYLPNRNLAYLYYGLYLFFNLTYLAYIFENLSIFSIFFKRYCAGFQINMVLPIMTLGYFFYAQFIRSILDTKKENPGFDRLLYFFGVGTLLVVPLDIVLGIILQIDVYLIFRKLTISIIFIVGLRIVYRAGKMGNTLAYLICAGSLCYSVGCFLGFLITYGHLSWPNPDSIFSDGFTYTQLAVLLEMGFFSVALGYRTGVIEEEKEKATTQLTEESFERKKLLFEQEKSREFEEKRSQFFNNTNHELRTPLTIIHAMAQEIEGNEEVKSSILRNSNAMIRIVNQMLDMAKLDFGNMTIHYQQDDIIRYLKYQMQHWKTYAETKHIHFDFSTDLSELMMDFDDKKLEQITANLIGNALKFTPENGHILVTASREAQHLQISFKDSGPGIPADQHSIIFDRFYQVNDDNNHKPSGTGIGLSLVKQLVELLSGSIAIQSQVDQGTEFTIRLPITQKAPIRNHIALPTIILPPMDSSEDQVPIENQAAKTVLLVEDNAEVLAYLNICVQGQYQVLSAVDGEVGYEMAVKHLPDLIISDVMMPKKDGYIMSQQLKTNSNTSHIPIILLTARATDEDRLKGLNHGADAYLTKPFHKEELLIRIANLIKIRSELHQHFRKDISKKTINTPSISAHDQQFLQELIDFIESNIEADNLDVNKLAEAVKMARATLHRKLKALTGYSASGFKKQIKMKYAEKLIQQEGYAIAEAAYAVGYKYPTNFSKDYKDIFGYPPTANQRN